jgi:hypothetical protein
MTAPTPNAALAYKVLDAARAVDRLEMADWTNSGIRAIGIEDLTGEVCGTTACLAGWTVALAGLKVNSEGHVFDGSGIAIGEVEYIAAGMLGITYLTAEDLFYCDNEGLDERLAEIFGPRPGGAS